MPTGLWYSAGVEYKYDDKWTFNVGYTYIRADKGKVKLNGFHDGDTAAVRCVPIMKTIFIFWPRQ